MQANEATTTVVIAAPSCDVEAVMTPGVVRLQRRRPAWKPQPERFVLSACG